MSNTATVSSFPFTTTTNGRTVTIEPYRPADFEPVVKMYSEFEPGHRKRGVPPRSESAIREWLTGLVENPSVVVRNEGVPVGHVQFVEDEHGQHELGLFLRHDFRSNSLKSILVEVGLEFADAQGIDTVWLTSGPSEIDSRQIFEDLGFTLDELDTSFGLCWLSRDI